MEMLQNSFLQHLLFVFNPNQITLQFALYENTLYCLCASFCSTDRFVLPPPQKVAYWEENVRHFLRYVRRFLKNVRCFFKYVRCFFKYVCCFLKTNGIALNRPWRQCACAVLQTTSVLENVNLTVLSPSRARVRARIGQEFYAFYFHICHTPL